MQLAFRERLNASSFIIAAQVGVPVARTTDAGLQVPESGERHASIHHRWSSALFDSNGKCLDQVGPCRAMTPRRQEPFRPGGTVGAMILGPGSQAQMSRNPRPPARSAALQTSGAEQLAEANWRSGAKWATPR